MTDTGKQLTHTESQMRPRHLNPVSIHHKKDHRMKQTSIMLRMGRREQPLPYSRSTECSRMS
jgi:hypothetical protein